MEYSEIKKLKEQFEQVPGTYLFNADRCRAGYHINMFCMSMSKDENRKAFLADEKGYLDSKFPQYMAGEMTGQGQDQYRAMMMDGGRIVKGNLDKKDNAGKVLTVSNNNHDFSKKAE
jgi:hypothetical protein